MFCNNCGMKGHGFRECRDPITSYGIILLKEPTMPILTEKASVLMIRRKDSLAFCEFLQGRYDPANTEFVKTLLSNMTIPELNRLKVDSFDTLWTALWGEGNDYHSKAYVDSKAKFDGIQNTPLIQSATSLFIEPEWGFPKGRRHSRENNTTCAIREFTEETNISREAYVLCKNLVFQETFKGTNGVEYRHVYFLAFLRNPKEVDLYRIMTDIQKQEVSRVQWMTLTECRQLVRPHYKERLELLDSFERSLNTFDLQDNIATQQE